MINLWDLYAMVYDSLPKHFRPYQELVEEVVSEVKKCPYGDSVLDVGCGTGNYSVALAKAGYNVIGIDYSDRMLRVANQKRNINGDKVQFIRMNLTNNLPYADNCFDCVVSIHSLYTIKETSRILKEYYRVLKPGGRLILSEPRYPVKVIACIKEAKERDGLKAAIEVFFSLFFIGLVNLVIMERQASGYYHYWSEREISEKLSEAGFNIISTKETYTNKSDVMVISSKI